MISVIKGKRVREKKRKWRYGIEVHGKGTEQPMIREERVRRWDTVCGCCDWLISQKMIDKDDKSDFEKG